MTKREEAANTELFPASGIIPTRNRAATLRVTLQSISQQNFQPTEIIIIDASDTDATEKLLIENFEGLRSELVYLKAATRGAASQRNEGVAIARCSYILFMDDDLLFEPSCFARLFSAIVLSPSLGGVNVMFTNQKYHPPGRISASLFSLLNGKKLKTYAGKCIGPVVNLLPEDKDELPEVVEVEWLNSGCTLYRKEALPDPPFPKFFTGYSMFEDVTISSIVGRQWKLANARTARVFHDSQPGDYKQNIFLLSKMELVNRFYVMTYVLNRRGFRNIFKFVVIELFKVASYFQNINGLRKVMPVIGGKIAGTIEVIHRGKRFT